LPLPKDHPPVVTETLRTPVNELATGSTFAGRYQFIEELGHGGMGKVYKVFDTKIKNLSHGLTDKPWELHGNNCDPYIAQVNALPAIAKKHKLIIADGLLGCCDGGPGYKSDGIGKYESLFFATDRVAFDTVATGIIEAARKLKGFPTLAAAGRPPKYLLTAEKIGLGNHDMARIDHRKVE
jgi:hypothetical protein